MTKRTSSPALPLIPPSFFGIVLGLAGLAGNWRIGENCSSARDSSDGWRLNRSCCTGFIQRRRCVRPWAFSWPPAVGALCCITVGSAYSGQLAHMMIGYALLQALILLRMYRWIREQPFAASYWAFTFGATALAGAVTRLSIGNPNGAYATLAPVLFVAANVLVLSIAAGTVRLLLQGKLLPAAQAPATS